MGLQTETPVMARRTNRPSSAGIVWLRNKRILLAEDNITNQMVATQMLDALGAKVDIANDGAEALEMIGVKDYDLFLIDIEMPRVSGLEVIRSIRSAAAPLRDAPVIAVTAYALREHRDKITEAGADGLIPKPLLGIEQFGRDIVALADHSYERGAEAAAEQAEAAGGGLVSLKVFAALEDAIGSDAMVGLLSKVDSDLAAAERAVKLCVQTLDRAALGAATHVLISVSGAIGAHGLQGLAQKLNAAAAGKADVNLDALAAEALKQIASVRVFVGDRLENSRA